MVISKTEKEKRELIVSAIDKSMFVEAGAGAGKSTLIVSRIINQLKNGIKPAEIVAITFTNAATYELKDRIVRAALKEMKNKSMTEQERTLMQTALVELDQMQVSTIHSFCNRILKEKSLDAKMSVDAQLIDESELAKRREESFTMWAEGLKRDDWNELLKSGGYRRTAINKVKNLSFQLMDMPKDMKIEISLPVITEDDFLNASSRILSEFAAAFVDAVNKAHYEQLNTVNAIPDAWLKKEGINFKSSFLNGNHMDCLKLLEKSKCKEMIKQPTLDELSRLAPAVGTTYDEQKVTKKLIKEMGKRDQDQAKNKILDFEDACQNKYFNGRNTSDNIALLLGRYENSLNKPYVLYAQKAATFILDRLGSDILTNNLLIQKTYELVKGSAEIRTYFAEKFKCIYVDEFQDTDHVQEAFIRMLAKDDNTGELRPGALFVVGDPKQSIYRFRGAEPEVYFTTKEYFKDLQEAYVIELQDNYRSNQYIIEWVNDQFKEKNITNGSPYVPMQVSKIIDDSLLDDKTIYGIYSNKSPYKIAEGYGIEADSEDLTALIKNLVELEYQIVDYDDHNNAYKRNICYKDFLILCMNMRDMDLYADRFRSYGIPFVMDSKLKMRDEWYLQVYARLFFYLADPYDRHHFEGAREALKSLGMSYIEADVILEGLYGMARESDSINKESTEETTSVKESYKMSPSGILRFLERNFLLLLKTYEVIPDTDVLELQTRVTQMTERVVQTSGGSTRALMDAVRLYLDSELEHELVLEDDVDAVRFMNLHKAKGLEGNIVIWTNRQENADFKPGAYRKNGIYYPSLETEITGFKTSIWNGINKDEKLIQEAKEDYRSEKIRLEYVAATRAKQAFIIMDRCSQKNTLFSENYDFGSRSIQQIIESKSLKVTNKQPVTKRIAIVNTVEETAEALSKPLYLSETPSRLEDESAGISGKDYALLEKSKAAKRPSGAVFGTIMHRSFELLIPRIHYKADFMKEHLGNVLTMQVIDACAIQAINENIAQIPKNELKAYKDFLHKMLIAFGKWWYREKMPERVEEIYTELAFSYFDKREAEEKKTVNESVADIWWHGIADLVLKLKNETILIIDYKSDDDIAYLDENSFCERLTGKYAPQIAMYKKAIAKSFGVDEGKISGMLISFSQKDVAKGEELRVRATEV